MSNANYTINNATEWTKTPGPNALGEPGWWVEFEYRGETMKNWYPKAMRSYEIRESLDGFYANLRLKKRPIREGDTQMNDSMNTVEIYTPNHDAAGSECTEFVPQDEWDAWNRYWSTINRSLSLFEEGIDSKDRRIKNLKTIREREVRFLVGRGWSKWDIRTVWEEVPPEMSKGETQ